MRKIALIASLALLLFSCGGPDPNADTTAAGEAAAPKAIGPAPEFDLQKIVGGSLKSTDLKGKVLVVDFWATWCQPCIQEIPSFNQLHEKSAGKDYVMLGITVESGSIDDVKSAVAELEHKMKYPVVMGDDDVVAGFGGIVGFPTTFIVGKDWKIYKKYLGMKPHKKEELERDIATLLAATS